MRRLTDGANQNQGLNNMWLEKLLAILVRVPAKIKGWFSFLLVRKPYWTCIWSFWSWEKTEIATDYSLLCSFSCNYGCYEVAYSCSLSFYVLNSAGFMLVILTMRELKLLLIILCYVVFSRYYGWYDVAYFRSLSFYVLNWAGFSFLLVKKPYWTCMLAILTMRENWNYYWLFFIM